jgi:peptide deformylase|tara:strand:+ start:994 stop:1560 length:567 start_codon:yes stop_codon:yes gene_type:complete
MAVFKLLESDNPILKVKLEDCNPELNRQEIKDNLIETMQHYEGIGLSANQVGVMERVFVMYNHVETKQIIACFNPKIIKEGEEKVLIDEGCLSFPGLWVKVNRPETIEVEYEDENGEKVQRELYGLQSRIFQHEYDHMEGSNFTEKVSKLKLDMAIKKQKKMDELAQRLKKKTEERLAQDKEYQKLIS